MSELYGMQIKIQVVFKENLSTDKIKKKWNKRKESGEYKSK